MHGPQSHMGLCCVHLEVHHNNHKQRTVTLGELEKERALKTGHEAERSKRVPSFESAEQIHDKDDVIKTYELLRLEKINLAPSTRRNHAPMVIGAALGRLYWS